MHVRILNISKLIVGKNEFTKKWSLSMASLFSNVMLWRQYMIGATIVRAEQWSLRLLNKNSTLSWFLERFVDMIGFSFKKGMNFKSFPYEIDANLTCRRIRKYRWISWIVFIFYKRIKRISSPSTTNLLLRYRSKCSHITSPNSFIAHIMSL